MRTYELSIQGHCPPKKTSMPIWRERNSDSTTGDFPQGRAVSAKEFRAGVEHKQGKPSIGKRTVVSDYETSAVIQLRAQWKGKPIDHDVLCSLCVYYYARKGLGRRPDAFGPAETVYDVLEAAGVVTNDVHIVPGGTIGVADFSTLIHRAIDRIPVRDRKEERVEITLVDLEGE